MNNKWTDDEITIVRLMMKKRSVSELAVFLRRTPCSVSRKIRCLLDTKHQPRPWTEQEVALIGTMPVVDLAALLQRSVAAVTKKAYWVARPGRRKEVERRRKPASSALVANGSSKPARQRSPECRDKVLARKKRYRDRHRDDPVFKERCAAHHRAYRTKARVDERDFNVMMVSFKLREKLNVATRIVH